MSVLGTSTEPIQQEKLERFLDGALGDLKGAMVLIMAHLGDRLGLFKALAKGPMSSEELARRSNLQERYVREWLAGMACAEYLEYDATHDRFLLPREHAQVLAEEGGACFLGGLYQEMPAVWGIIDQLSTRFHSGGGVALADYRSDWWTGMERFTCTWIRNFLLQQWIPGAEGVEESLRQGLPVADLGCGRGRALATLAKAFPRITGVGYDLGDSNLEAARRLAREEGVGDRISFLKHDVQRGLTGRFGLALSLDTLHDLADPAAAFRAVHDSLYDGGSFLVLEFKVSDRLEDNIGPMGAMLYAWSLSYCLTTALGMGGTGVGTCGMPESRIRQLAREAGFKSVSQVPFDNPFNVLYQVRK